MRRYDPVVAGFIHYEPITEPVIWLCDEAVAALADETEGRAMAVLPTMPSH